MVNSKLIEIINNLKNKRMSDVEIKDILLGYNYTEQEIDENIGYYNKTHGINTKSYLEKYYELNPELEKEEEKGNKEKAKKSKISKKSKRKEKHSSQENNKKEKENNKQEKTKEKKEREKTSKKNSIIIFIGIVIIIALLAVITYLLFKYNLIKF